MRRVLVSGFEAFASLDRNPSEVAVRALREKGIEGVSTVLLPVTWEGAARLLRARADGDGVDACLLFGVARSTTTLRVEALAQNATNAMADNADALRNEAPLVEGALDRPADADLLQRFSDALTAAGVTHLRSEDAGRYVCNALYFSALGAGRRWSRRTVFVHVPPCTTEDEQAALNAQVEAAVKVYRDLDA